MTEFPEVLSPYREAIDATRRPIAGATIGEATAPSDMTTSRLGGMPWWPAGRPWPVDVRGAPLQLLIQINFSEVPPLIPFPSAGLLQLFIGTDADFGCDFDLGKPHGFQVAFHYPFQGPNRLDHPIEEFGRGMDSPLAQPLVSRSLKFAVSSMPCPMSCREYRKVSPKLREGVDVTGRAYQDFVYKTTPRIRLGGYPNFVQDDPRRGSDFDFCVLTMESTEGLLWGDVGVAQFFAERSDIAARDFTKIKYHFDSC